MIPPARKWKHGPVLADEMRAELAVAAESHRAAHVAFDRDEDPLRRHFARQRLEHDKPHHDLRPAGHHRRFARLQTEAIEQHRHDADVPVPIVVADVDGDLDF